MVAVSGALRGLEVVADYTVGERPGVAARLLFMLTVGLGGIFFARRIDDFHATKLGRLYTLQPRWPRVLSMRAIGILALYILVTVGYLVMKAIF